MRTSQKGIDLIKQLEGCRLHAYKPVPTEQYWTIGYGHYGPDVSANMVINQAQAEALLREDLVKFENNVNKYDGKYHWTQNELDALVSFAYNLGSIDRLTANGTRSKADIADKMLLYNIAGGKVLAGLTRRREAERELFLDGKTTPQIPYQIGKVYVTAENLHVRDIPNGQKLKMDSLTENGKKNACFDNMGYALIKAKTRVTCKEVRVIGDNIWMKIPSGWLCAKSEGKNYIE